MYANVFNAVFVTSYFLISVNLRCCLRLHLLLGRARGCPGNICISLGEKSIARVQYHDMSRCGAGSKACIGLRDAAPRPGFDMSEIITYCICV